MMQRSTRIDGCIAAPKPAKGIPLYVHTAGLTYSLEGFVFVKSRMSALFRLKAARWPWSDSDRLKEGELSFSEPASASSSNLQVKWMQRVWQEADSLLAGVV
jgi:hypothetical protein